MPGWQTNVNVNMPGLLSAHALSQTRHTTRPKGAGRAGRMPPVAVVAVLGGCGFIGRHVVNALLAGSPKSAVIVIDRAIAPLPPTVELRIADCGNADELRQALAGVTCIIQCTGLVDTRSGRFHEPRIRRANVEAVEQLLAACRAVGVRRLVALSSASALSDGVWGDNHAATSGTGRASAYGRSKYDAEGLVRAANSPALRTVSIRPQMVFGPGDPLVSEDMLLSDVLPPTVGDEQRTHTPIYVKNLAALLVRAAAELPVDDGPTSSALAAGNDRHLPRLRGGEILNAGDAHVPSSEIRALLLSCRAAPPRYPLHGLLPERIPLAIAWLLACCLEALDSFFCILLVTPLPWKALKLTRAALYYMCGAEFTFERDAYAALGMKPPFSFPDGVAADLTAYAAAKAATRAAPPPALALPFYDGATVVLTGGTAGLGVALLDELARHAATIFLVCRSRTKGEDARARCRAAGAPAAIVVVLADLTSMHEVAEAARTIREACSRSQTCIDSVILNAAMFAACGLRGSRVLSTEGIEVQFAANVCAPHLLLRKLLPSIRPAHGRVLVTGSGAPRAVGWRLEQDDSVAPQLQGEAGVGSAGFQQYTLTKLMVAMLAAEWTRREPGLDVLVWNPGATDSRIAHFPRTCAPNLGTCAPKLGTCASNALPLRTLHILTGRSVRLSAQRWATTSRRGWP